MSPRLHPEFLPTLGVLLVVAFAVGSLLSPPDPFAQLLYAGPGVALAAVAAALLTYGGGYERLGVSPTGRDHTWTVAGFLAGFVLAGVIVPDPTSAAAGGGALLAGLLLGTWLGWGRGRRRLGFRSRNP